MAQGKDLSTTPKSNPRVLKKSTSSTQNAKKNQASILGFFQPKSSPCTPTPPASSNARQNQSQARCQTLTLTQTQTQTRKGASELPSSPAQRAAEDRRARQSAGSKKNGKVDLTPVPGSDIVGSEDGDVDVKGAGSDGVAQNGSVTPSRRVGSKLRFFGADGDLGA